MFAVDWSDRVNDIERGQLAASGDHSFAGRQSFGKTSAPNLPALGEDLRSAGAMNRAVHTAAAEQRGIGRVHNCLNVLFGDVANDDAHAAVEKFWGVLLIRVHLR